MDIEISEDVGCVVGYAPGLPGSEVRVSLLKVAERLAARGKIPPLTQEQRVALANWGRTDVSGPVAKKIKKAVAKVAKPVVKVAKAVAKSKVVKAVVKTAAKIVPPPASFAITGAQAAAKLGKALASKNPKTKAKAKKIAPLVKAAAKGKVSLPKLQAEAKKIGVSPALATEAAAVAKVADMAEAGDPDAKAALNVASQITDPNVKEVEKAADTIGKLAVVKQLESGDARAFIVRTPEGKEYRTMVVPADAGASAEG